MNKAEFLKEVEQAWAEWQALLAKIELEEMSDPVMEGGWRLKDIIAHITWYEREMIGVLQSRALVGSELWELPNDARNAAIYAAHKEAPVEQILAQAEQNHAALMPLLETLTDAELNDASRFAEMPPEWLPWEVLASNTFEHYRGHLPTVGNWLANKTSA